MRQSFHDFKITNPKLFIDHQAVRMTFTHATYGPLKENAMLTRSG